MGSIRRRIKRHTAPSVQIGMGRGRSGLGLKLHALAHALRLLSPDLHALAQLFTHMPCWLTDQGTERGLANLRSVPLLSLVPPTAEAGAQQAEAGEVEVELAPPDGPQDPPAAEVEEVNFASPLAEGDLVADLSASVEIHDLLHCIHNATKDLSKSMAGYQDVIFQARKVADLVRKKESKERLIQTCFSSGPGRELARDLRRFTAHIHEERFGTVASCVPKLLALQTTLQWGWDLSKYAAGHAGPVGPERAQADNDGEDEYEGSRIDVVDQAIHSPFFWSYLQALQSLAEALAVAMSWAEGCACHWHLDREAVGKESSSLWRSCPLRCRRVPELAAGDFTKEVQSCLVTAASKLSLQLSAALSDTERTTILSDFESGRNHLMFYFNFKCSYFQDPPWCVFAMAHANAEVAAQAEERARTSECEHPLVMQLRQEPLRSQIQTWRTRCEEFQASGQVDDLKLLREFLAKLRFAPHNSRYVEAEHAKIQVGLRRAHRHSDAFVSLLRRQPALVAEVRDNPSILDELAANVAEIRHGRDAVRRMGLAAHPACPPPGRDCNSPEWWKIAYHSDPFTKFAMSSPLVGSSDPPGPLKAFAGSAEGVLEAMNDHQRMQQRYMVQHLLGHASDLTRVYSMPMPPKTFHVLASTLRDQGGEDAHAVSEGLAEGLRAHMPGFSEEAAALVFWKVVYSQPSRLVKPRTGQEFDLRSALVVSVHSLLHVSIEARCAHVSVDSLNRQAADGSIVPMVFSPAALPIDALSTIKVWDRLDTGMQYFMSTLQLAGADQQALSNLLRDMEKADRGLVLAASPDGDRQVRLLEDLKGRGWAQGPPWCLTDAGQVRLAVGARIGKARDAFQLPTDLRAEGLTTCELMMHLAQQDWVHAVVDRAGVKKARQSPYLDGDDGSAKTWYSKRGEVTVNHQYLLALALAATHGKAVPHFASEREYKLLIDPGAKIPVRLPKRRKLTIPLDMIRSCDEFDWPEDSRAPLAPLDAPGSTDAPQQAACSDGDSSAASSSSSGISTSSSSSSRSSSYSESEGQGSAAEALEAGSAQAQEPTTRPARTFERTIKWGFLQITPKFNKTDGPAFCFQLNCKHPQHGRCNKTRNVGPHASPSPDHAIRMLKQWALLGTELPDKGAHKDAWESVLAASASGDLPSMAALDAQRIDGPERYA